MEDGRMQGKALTINLLGTRQSLEVLKGGSAHPDTLCGINYREMRRGKV